MGQCLITRKGGSAMSAKLLGTYTDTSYSSNDNSKNTIIKKFEVDTSYDYYLIKAEYSSSVTGKYGYSIVSRENLLSNACGVVVTYVDSSNKWQYVARGLKMDDTGIIVSASYNSSTCLIREIWGLKKFIKKSANNKNYIFKDGEWSITPTTNSFTSSSNMLLQGANSTIKFNVDSNLYVYVGCYFDSSSISGHGPKVVSGTTQFAKKSDENGLSYFILRVTSNGTVTITGTQTNYNAKFYIKDIWTEEIQL